MAGRNRTGSHATSTLWALDARSCGLLDVAMEIFEEETEVKFNQVEGTMSTISDVTSSLVGIDRVTVDLRGMAEKPSGAWAPGWYPAEVIEGYTASGHPYLTGVSISRAQDSYNVRLCLRVTNGKEVRSTFYSLNYRPVDFTPERLETAQRLRAEFAGQKGAWVGYEDIQRSSLAVGKLGQLQEAAGRTFSMSPDGMIDVSPFVGAKFFVRMNIDEEGYNVINRASKFSNGVEPKGKAARRTSKASR